MLRPNQHRLQPHAQHTLQMPWGKTSSTPISCFTCINNDVTFFQMPWPNKHMFGEIVGIHQLPSPSLQMLVLMGPLASAIGLGFIINIVQKTADPNHLPNPRYTCLGEAALRRFPGLHYKCKRRFPLLAQPTSNMLWRKTALSSAIWCCPHDQILVNRSTKSHNVLHPQYVGFNQLPLHIPACS